MTEFESVAADRLRVIGRTQLAAGQCIEFTERDTIHLVRNLGAHDAIDLHFCGPSGAQDAKRYTPRQAGSTLVVGQELAVDIVTDRLPVVMSTPSTPGE